MTTTARRTVPATTWALRATAVLSTLGVLYQGVTAGGVVNSVSGAYGSHQTGAIVLHVLTGLMVVAAALDRRLARGPVAPAVLSFVVFAATFVEAKLGEDTTLWVHVPLAMLITAATAVVLVGAWRRTD